MIRWNPARKSVGVITSPPAQMLAQGPAEVTFQASVEVFVLQTLCQAIFGRAVATGKLTAENRCFPARYASLSRRSQRFSRPALLIKSQATLLRRLAESSQHRQRTTAPIARFDISPLLIPHPSHGPIMQISGTTFFDFGNHSSETCSTCCPQA